MNWDLQDEVIVPVHRAILLAVQNDASYFSPFPRKVRIRNLEQSRDLFTASISSARSVNQVILSKGCRKLI